MESGEAERRKSIQQLKEISSCVSLALLLGFLAITLNI
jgi:hypothetical protein